MAADVQSGAIQALVFDIFGTVVDWRNGIARAVEQHLVPLDPAVNPGAFADAWRGYYQPSMAEIRSGVRGWVNLDVLHAENLDRVLEDFGIEGISDDVRDELVRAWHHLDVWPDVRSGLHALRHSFLLAPLSNGHIALSIALARHNDLHWDAILGAELARNYKPAEHVYLAGVTALGLHPGNVLMVACHSDDLEAARAAGLRTAHVARPDEKGPGLGEKGPSTEVDFSASELVDLADRLGGLTSAA